MGSSTIFASASWSSLAETEPALPNPWTATRAPSSGIPRYLSASAAVSITPRPVASWRPSDPPISIGFPVTELMALHPSVMLMVSMNQAMICASV